ncbi:MAG: carbohydrate ABC transporter permease [Clostridiales bacterium]|nr:carbohydrate ABC transporter permease [Clostridiales bacterium]
MVEKKFGFWWIVRCITLWFVVFIMVFPFLHMVSVSLSSNLMVMQNKIIFWPLIGKGQLGITLDTYKFILSKPLIYIAYKNTITYVVVGTVVALFVLTTGAYALSKKRCPGGKLFNILIMITMFFRGGMIPLFLAIKWLGMLDTIWAIVLPSAFSAWNVIIMRSFFSVFPAEIEESGRLDGLNDIGILWYLVLPTSTAILATIGLFVAVAQWNSFFAPLLYLSDEKKYPLQIILRQLVLQSVMEGMEGAASNTNFAEDSIKYSTILVSIIPIIAVYPFLQKYFVKGVMIGSIKG